MKSAFGITVAVLVACSPSADVGIDFFNHPGTDTDTIPDASADTDTDTGSDTNSDADSDTDTSDPLKVCAIPNTHVFASDLRGGDRAQT